MRGLDPLIHQSSQEHFLKVMDGRIESGHDEGLAEPPQF
jgi:hypothetical protein